MTSNETPTPTPTPGTDAGEQRVILEGTYQLGMSERWAAHVAATTPDEPSVLKEPTVSRFERRKAARAELRNAARGE